MTHRSLDIYDDMPRYMKMYISNYGWHFNKQAYEYAVKSMYKKNTRTGRDEKVEKMTKEEVDALLKKYSISLSNNKMYDYIYVATMCKADFAKAIPDNEHLAYFVKETIDDEDASDETTFRRWVATMVGNGNPIDWEEIC